MMTARLDPYTCLNRSPKEIWAGIAQEGQAPDSVFGPWFSCAVVDVRWINRVTRKAWYAYLMQACGEMCITGTAFGREHAITAAVKEKTRWVSPNLALFRACIGTELDEVHASRTGAGYELAAIRVGHLAIAPSVSELSTLHRSMPVEEVHRRMWPNEAERTKSVPQSTLLAEWKAALMGGASDGPTDASKPVIPVTEEERARLDSVRNFAEGIAAIKTLLK